MVFKLFRKITTPPKPTPNSMSYFAVITFNTYSKKLTNRLLIIFKSSDKTVPQITRNSSVLNTQCFKFSLQSLDCS